jgi:hypothetical protein
MNIRPSRWVFGLAAVVALAVAVPVWAHTDSVPISFNQKMDVAGTTLQPGSYEFRVTPSNPEVEIVNTKDHKVVATVQGKWVNLNSKSQYTQVLSDRNQVQEIDLSGQVEAIRFAQSSPNQGM